MLRYLMALCLMPLAASSSARLGAAGPPVVRSPICVGQIIIVGNVRTRDNVILDQVLLIPGKEIAYSDIRRAERNLRRLGFFMDHDGFYPTVRILDNPLDPDNPYKDVLVSVVDEETFGLVFSLDFRLETGLNVRVGVEERNFDLFRPPTSADDLSNGVAFRGAGQNFFAGLRFSPNSGFSAAATLDDKLMIWGRKPARLPSPFASIGVRIEGAPVRGLALSLGVR